MRIWFQIFKGTSVKVCILSPCLFNFYAEDIMRNAGLEETQAGIKIARRNISHLRSKLSPFVMFPKAPLIITIRFPDPY